MTVHRISDAAEALLQELAATDGKKPGEWLSGLIVDYHAGLSFARKVTGNKFTVGCAPSA